jgi:hypothetical protein
VSSLICGVGEFLLDDLERSRAELAQVETPWEPYDALDRVINDIAVVDEYVWVTCPWPLATSFLKVVERAKDSCSPSRAADMARLMQQIESAIGRRPVIDRLGDLA